MPAKLIANIFLEAFVDFPRLILVSEETTKVLLASFQRTLKALFILITPRDIHQTIELPAQVYPQILKMHTLRNTNNHIWLAA